MLTSELIDHASWQHAPTGFGPVSEQPRAPRSKLVPAFELAFADAPFQAWGRLCELWLQLPAHLHVLSAIARTPHGLRLHYAALDWLRASATVDEAPQLAAWGGQLADVYDYLVANVPEQELGRFCRPHVAIDLGGHVRVAFLPCGPSLGNELWPPELRRTWPAAKPATLVHVIATQVALLAEDIEVFRGTRLGDLIAMAASASPLDRHADPRRLGQLFTSIGLANKGRRPSRFFEVAAWNAVERGLGWLATEHRVRALAAFELALEHGYCMELALVGRLRTQEACGLPPTPWQPRTSKPIRVDTLLARARGAWAVATQQPWSNLPYAVPEPPLSWSEAAEIGGALEEQRAFADACRCYHRAAPSADRDVALARCYLANALAGSAIQHARDALSADADRFDARWLLVRARLAHGMGGDVEQALADADAMVTRWPDEGIAHYLRGKCLLRLSRLPDARAAFDRACELSPQLLEAMLLRREVVRVGGVARAQAGDPDQPAGEGVAPDAGMLSDGDLLAATGASDAHLAALKLREVGG